MLTCCYCQNTLAMIMAIVVDYYCYINLVGQLQVVVIIITLGVIITIAMMATIVIIQIIIIAITDITQPIKVSLVQAIITIIIVVMQVEHRHLNQSQVDQSLVFAVVFPST